MILWSCGLRFAKSSDKLNALYLHLHSTNSHQHGKLLAYREALPPSLEVIWQIKSISPFHNAYDHQTCQGGDIPQGIPFFKFVWPLNEVVLWGHATSQTYDISTCRRPMNTELGNLLTYSERLSRLRPHEHLITWAPWGLYNNFKNLYLHFHNFHKIGRVLNFGRRFSMETRKLSPTPCLFFPPFISHRLLLRNCQNFYQ